MSLRFTSLPLALSLALSAATAADWQPAAGPLMTRWAKEVSPDKAHPEYPRPQLVRDNWTNLNGLWEYSVRSADSKLSEKWDGQILVPFPIESALSGVMKRVGANDKLWYRRTFKTPDLKSGRRLLLNFGAVDWHCEVWVNGVKVGEHTGGYDPFTFDITDALDRGKPEQELVVMVADPTDANWQPRGKQVQEPKGIWYTPTTGIWQTVWLEEVPAKYIRGLRVTPNVDTGEVQVAIDAVGEKRGNYSGIVVSDGDREVVAHYDNSGVPDKPVVLKLPKPKLWSPDSPFLYTLKVSIDGKGGDQVTSYFGMRKIALGKDEQGVTRLMLNNQPLFQFGPLDQGFWPDGLYTAPTDAAMKYDLEVTKQLGFNMIRKHVKVEPARWYRYCDQMGILVWQDMPSGDKHAPWNPMGAHNGKQIERSKESADNYRAEWKAIIDTLYHFPSIVVWVPFNEAWGQFDTQGVSRWTEQHDPSRLVNCASGGNDFPVGQISDLHRYPGPTIPALESARAAVLGEFGGLGLPLEGHTWQAKNNWGYRSFESKEALNAAYEQLIRRLRPLIGKGLSAAVYTQTTDVEVEVNGFMTYDREVIKLEPQKTAALHAKLYQPPPKEVVLVPTSRETAQTWRFTTDKPAPGWEQAAFDDASWNEGPGGFGEPSTPGSKVRTTWKTPDIWLRRTIDIPSGPLDGLALNIHHDEDVEVYLNGVLVFSTKGYLTDYIAVPLDEKVTAAIKPGKNTIAVHCHQTGGGQYVDVGLLRLEETPRK
jgi:Glycosyl hydrolases family 2, sugar binding domain/Glycosyl hydrolases family 2/Glycosyl hydrolases family 2, TIM barrel domain